MTEGVGGRVTGSSQSFILAHLHGRRCVPDFLDSGGSQRDVEAGYDGCVISPGSSSIISTTQLALFTKGNGVRGVMDEVHRVNRPPQCMVTRRSRMIGSARPRIPEDAYLQMSTFGTSIIAQA